MGTGRAKICAAVALWSVALACAGTASAQPRSPAPVSAPRRSVLVAPKLTFKPEVPYPSTAHGDAVVVLELLVDASGAVAEALVATGDEPFASAALGRARELRFDPATRDGKPVAARIHVELRFREPTPSPEPPTSAPSAPSDASTSPPSPAKPSPTIEVIVTGQPIEAEKVVMTGAEVRQLPGAFGDAFRAIEAMPGVTPIFSGVPFFYIRGAPPGNAGYFLDGIRVPLLYHFALGPSVINPALVDRVELFPGAYPARYGRFAGGIVAAETKPPEYELHGEGNVRVFDAGAMVEAPLPDRRGAVLLGGRYSYTAAVLSLLAPGVTLAYWDYQGRVVYRLTARDTLSAFAFGSYDFYGQDGDNGATEPIAAAEFHRLDLRWDHSVSAQTQLRLAATLGTDETLAGDDELDLRDHSVRLRTEMKSRIDSATVLSAGADTGLDDYLVHYRPRSVSGVDTPPGTPTPTPVSTPPSDTQQLEDLLPPRQDLSSGAWVEVAWRPVPNVLLTPGLRLDYYVIEHASALPVEPRLSALYEVTRKLRIKHALGLAEQPPSFVVPVPGFALGGLDQGLQRSIQASSGVEVDLPQRFTGSLTFFDNVFLNMTDFLSRNELDSNVKDLMSRSIGSGIGVEVLVRRPLTERLGGFVAYTLSRSTRSVGDRSYLSRFDRTHVLNFALGYDLGRRWRAGARWMYYSGFPAAHEYRITRNGTSYQFYTQYQRTSPFYRVDLRLEKQWSLGQTGHWSLVFEFLNATLNKEVVGVDCTNDFAPTSGGPPKLTCSEQRVGPVSIPSIGVEAAF